MTPKNKIAFNGFLFYCILQRGVELNAPVLCCGDSQELKGQCKKILFGFLASLNLVLAHS